MSAPRGRRRKKSASRAKSGIGRILQSRKVKPRGGGKGGGKPRGTDLFFIAIVGID